MKYLIITKAPNNSPPLQIDNIKIEKVRKFEYLCTVLEDSNNHPPEIKHQIDMARKEFYKLKLLITNKNLNLQLREEQ